LLSVINKNFIRFNAVSNVDFFAGTNGFDSSNSGTCPRIVFDSQKMDFGLDPPYITYGSTATITNGNFEWSVFYYTSLKIYKSGSDYAFASSRHFQIRFIRNTVTGRQYIELGIRNFANYTNEGNISMTITINGTANSNVVLLDGISTKPWRFTTFTSDSAGTTWSVEQDTYVNTGVFTQ